MTTIVRFAHLSHHLTFYLEPTISPTLPITPIIPPSEVDEISRSVESLR